MSSHYKWPDDITLEAEPEKDHIWAAVEVFTENLDLDETRPDHPERELWYAPTIGIRDAYRAEALFEEYGVRHVHDLGAGDCRLALWLDRRDFDVVAYELNPELVEAVQQRFSLGSVDLRRRDYYEDYDDLVASDAAVVAFGGTNVLPYIPETGLAIQGYWEKGVTAYYDGECIAQW